MPVDKSALLPEDLILSIYGGVKETPPWTSLTSKLHKLLNCSDFSFIFRPPSKTDSGFVIHCREHLDWSERYAPYLFECDPLNNIEPLRAETLCGLTRDKLDSKDNYLVNFIKPLKIADVLAINGSGDREVQLKLRFFRYIGEANFSESDKKLTESLINHLEIAAELHRQVLMVKTSRRTVSSFLDNLDSAAISIDDSFRILHHNSVAQRIFDENKVFNINSGHLQLTRHQDQKKLEALVLDVCSAYIKGDDHISLGMKTANSSVSIVVKPILQPREISYTSPGAMLFISTDELHINIDEKLLRSIFDLTEAESRLAGLLVNGFTSNDAADILGVSINTIKSQIRALLTKTSVSRQADLLRLIWQLAI
ncbi:MAG: DNA-binding CsgD family transcriptional regulator [Patiriisocius sp.]|jgi:DNA-binding CsgD family transcriptional regulator